MHHANLTVSKEFPETPKIERRNHYETSLFFYRHEWEGCKCVRCGEVKHDFEIIEHTLEDVGTCCWSSDIPCDGPHCGVACENWSTGNGGMVVTVKECRRCGERLVESTPKEYTY